MGLLTQTAVGQKRTVETLRSHERSYPPFIGLPSGAKGGVLVTLDEKAVNNVASAVILSLVLRALNLELWILDS
jgi:hypothetical protein